MFGNGWWGSYDVCSWSWRRVLSGWSIAGRVIPRMTLVGGHRIGTFGRDHDNGLAAVACACSESIFACSESVCDCIYWGLGGTVSKMFP